MELRAVSEHGGPVALRVDGVPVMERDASPGELVSVWWSPELAGEHRIEARAGTTAVEATVCAHDVETGALPWFQAAWVDPGGYGPTGYEFDVAPGRDDVTTMLEAMRDLGMSMVVVTYVEYTGAFYYPSELSFFDRDMGRVARGMHLDFDLVGAVLDDADRLGLHVILGLGRGGDTPLLWEFDEPDWDARNAEAIAIGTAVADELWDRYGHHASLYGWYLTHEMNDLRRSAAYYDPLARHLHSLAPEKPVMVAPAGTPVLDAATLEASEVDVFAYQDAVGAGYVPYEYTWDPERRIAQLDETYSAYRAAHAGTSKHLWADLEIWEMDGSQGYSSSYPPPPGRVLRQLEAAARHVDVVTAYEWTGFVAPPTAGATRTDPRARELYEGYREYVATTPVGGSLHA
jgi:hypothetical protein